MTSPAWAIVVPLAGACVALLVRGRLLVPVGVATSAAALVASACVAIDVWAGGPLHHAVGGWSPPLGIELRADGLSAVMLLMTAGVGLPVSVHAAAYFARDRPAPPGVWGAREGFWPLWLFLWAALNAIFLAGDVFNLYVALELLTMAAVGLVILAGDRPALGAAMRYLLAAFLGSLAYLLGVALLYAAFDTLDIRLLAQRVAPGAPASAALALITTGLLLKTALFPLHFWLPRAHASAVAPASAILSALVVKGSFYMVIRLWLEVFPGTVTAAGAQLVGALGALAVVWGALQAIRQHRLKLLVAYSTVSQIGYLFLMLPLVLPAAGEAAAWRHDAWAGGVYHALSHGFAKASMFLAAGTIAVAAGTDRIRGLHGLAGRLPLAVFAFGLAGLTVVGVPPSGGFVAKWLLLSAAIASGQWWWTLVILAGGLLSAGYVFLVLTHALTPAAGDPSSGRVPHARAMQAASFTLALAALLLGLRAAEPLRLLAVGAP